ncbi:DUF2384 domain-containing protein [Bradyrhizobium yuanmingense]|uniref:antitoxin Xre/MbcA/ParS toxin-binding domain-containing protein n=1 Tax=Bradyrhizobium yuanmingense TaxID=108015 RepID=UPI0021A4CA05|nr:antitoxin Xre/MbcA/ParS toxin-binding domain-containing protein [Bradyrhizobium sp. CB1024]UWU82982.1 DUF2384 domain-containing protein [Bradyrhizobium sp. CB1024]
MMPASAQSKPSAKAIPDLSREEIRAELSPSAIDAFITLSDIWRLTTKQAVALLGEGSERTWFRIKAREWDGVLSQDSLTRVSALIGIYKGLHLLFSERLADEWVRRPNTEAIFAGSAPIDVMIAEGIPAMIRTRGYIDALRGGL